MECGELMVGSALANGRYELLEQIGEGGAARVYRARDHYLGRDVAVKVLRPELAGDPEFAERFQREATSAANLAHPNIAQIHDIGTDNGVSYFVMELAAGGTLRDRIRQHGRLTPDSALGIAEGVACALRHAHDAGIVHRDIKPLNILFSREGDVKVVDFGIARALSQTRISQTGTIVGSVHYVSPEQARGDAATPQSDLYSLGVVLYEMLIGQVPYEGETPVSVALQHIQGPTPDLMEVDPSLGEGVSAIVRRAMSKDVAVRYRSAREILEDIQSVRRGLAPAPAPVGASPSYTDDMTRRIQRPSVPPPPPTTFRGPSPFDEPVQQDGLSSVTWALVFLTVVVLLAGIGVIWWLQSGGASRLAGTPPKPPPTTTVVQMPSVLSLPRGDALNALDRAGIDTSRVRTNYRDSDATPDIVLDQEPGPNALWHSGESVVLYVSRKPGETGTIAVPNVIGIDSATAMDKLQALGLRAQATDEQTVRRVQKGTVLDQEPRAGSKVNKGATVRLKVALPIESEPPTLPREPITPDRPPPGTNGTEPGNGTPPENGGTPPAKKGYTEPPTKGTTPTTKTKTSGPGTKSSPPGSTGKAGSAGGTSGGGNDG
jgi:serine/threonine-protein kinase